MALRVLKNLERTPINYSSEYKKYQDIILKETPLTTTGNITWTSTSSGYEYNSSSGENGLLTILQGVVDDYILFAADYNDMANEIGDLSTLTTTEKSSIVGAVNEVNAVKVGVSDYSKLGISATTSGVANTYTLDLTPNLSGYTTGLKLTLIIHATNTNGSTINIDGLGAIALKKNDGTDYGSGELIINTPYTFVYNGTSFLADSSGGMGNFFGDGSDGTIPNLNTITTAPNGGTVANLWDMNTGTTFTTNSLSSASDQVVFSIDFGVPQYIVPSGAPLVGVRLFQTLISTGVNRNIESQYSDDNINWTTVTSVAVTTSANSINLYGHSSSHRYFRLVLKSGGSNCTISIQGIILNLDSADTQTTKVWRIIYPTTLNSGIAIKNFTSLTLPTGYEITTDNPCRGLVLYSQGDVNISGVVDMSQKACVAPNGESMPMLITKKAFKTAKTSSLLHFDNNITDANGRTWTNNGSATFDATNKKFGTHAISFNGTSQWIDTPASDDFSSYDDFTVDCWVRPTATGVARYIFSNGNSSTSYWSMAGLIQADNTFRFDLYNKYIASTTTIVANIWYHVAFVKYGDKIQLYINGVKEAEAFIVNPLYPPIYKFSIGRNGEANASYFAGQIDEFRIIKGKAMYTANFTPPTSEYTYTATYTDTPDTIAKYFQLSTSLQNLKGGYGGNGGYGGGGNGSTGRQTSVGIGGSGRQNLGGFGGGGSGGGYNPGSAYIGGIGGSVPYSEIGGCNVTLRQRTPSAMIPICGDGVNGSGATGVIYNTTAVQNYITGFSYGGGSGGTGASESTKASDSSNSQYAGGLVVIICGGNFSNSGAIKSNGGNGSNGTNGVGSASGGGGGGGGSGGGVVAIFNKGTYTNNGTITVTGGTGGAGGALAGTGEAGGSGTSGSVGTIHQQTL